VAVTSSSVGWDSASIRFSINGWILKGIKVWLRVVCRKADIAALLSKCFAREAW